MHQATAGLLHMLRAWAFLASILLSHKPRTSKQQMEVREKSRYIISKLVPGQFLKAYISKYQHDHQAASRSQQ